MNEFQIFVSAGEPSGDNAGALLLSAIRKKCSKAAFFGLGGTRMHKENQEQLADSSRLAVMGFWEVARQYSFFRKLFHECLSEIKKRKPRCVVLIDYPGFNLRLAKEVKKLEIPVIYYISPQVWAWGEKRVNEIKRYIDRMIVILPFEKDFYQKHGTKCDFVGHYLLEDIPATYIKSPISTGSQIALLPGSRKLEIERLLPPMIEAASRFNHEYGTKAVVAGVRGAYDYKSAIDSKMSKTISIVYDGPRRVIFESSMVLTKSGTATLESAIIGRPMVVAYKTGFISYQIAKRLVKLDKIALVNLVLGNKVVPELIQGDANADNMYGELKKLRDNRQYFDNIKKNLDQVPQLLGGVGASERTAEIILELIN